MYIHVCIVIAGLSYFVCLEIRMNLITDFELAIYSGGQLRDCQDQAQVTEQQHIEQNMIRPQRSTLNAWYVNLIISIQ